MKRPKTEAYREVGSVEGYIRNLSRDDNGRAVMTIKARVGGKDIKCCLQDEAIKAVRQLNAGEVIDGKRVRASGIIWHNAPREIDHVDVHRLEFPSSRGPTLEQIVDPQFTGGMTSEDYLDALREGN